MYKQAYHNKDISSSTFLVTGGAGFIGSNIVEYLLTYNAKKVVVEVFEGKEGWRTAMLQTIEDAKKGNKEI